MSTNSNSMTRSLILLLALITICGSLDSRSTAQALPPAAAAAKKANTPVDPNLIAADNDFCFKLYGELAKRDSGRNLFISPSSVALALDMVYNGARGDTQRGMDGALSLNEMTPQAVNAGNAALIASLNDPDPKVELSIADSLWIQPGMIVNPSFIKVNQDVYGAEVAPLTSIDIVNNWVSKQTHEKIKSILSPGDEKTKVLLINAIYFKGLWSQPFKKEDTKDGPFTLLTGKTKTAKLMHQSGSYAYFKGDGFQAARLPYGSGRLQMVILLPDKGTRIGALTAILTAENWKIWAARFASRPGAIALPLFRAEYEAKLLPTLKKLGMTGSDFGGIAPRLYISDVRHKTFLQVSEEGTEAAAVTSIHMKRSAILARPPEPFSMIVDHPFVCSIVDMKTGAILFLGTIVEPM